MVGSYASSAHGEWRSTQDVDFVADIPMESVDALYDALKDAYYIDPKSIRRAIEAGRPAASLRRATLTIAPALAVVSIALCAVASPMQAIGLLLVTSLCFAPASATIGVVSATLAGPRAAGRWYAAQNLAGQVSGVLAPIVTGLIIDVTGHYAAAFLCAALLSLLSAFAFGVVVGRYEPVRWRSSPRSEQGSG